MHHDHPFCAADPTDPAGASGSDATDAAQDALGAAAQAISGLAAEAAGATVNDQSSATPGSPREHAARPVNLPAFAGHISPSQARALELLSDVNLRVKIELGRTRMLVEDVLRLGEGAVVELDKLAGDPVDVYVNERHIARGEVLVLNDNFCVRINEIVQSPVDQVRSPATVKPEPVKQ